MNGVIQGFGTIALVIGLGVLLGHLGVFDVAGQRLLANLAFFVASPALLLVTVGRADAHQVLSAGALVAALSALVVMAIYLPIARWVWRRRWGHIVIGSLTTGYVNSANLGIPIASYVLGNAAYVAPILLLQLLVLQPAALSLLDADAAGRRPPPGRVVLDTLRNPLTAGTLIGLLLSLTGWRLPLLLEAPIMLVGNMAVPAMLLAFGLALRLGPGLAGDNRSELAATTLLKVLGQPLAAWGLALALGLSGHALLVCVVLASLPTAQNIFILASRYDRAEVLARDTIFLTTIASVPAIVLAAWLLS